MIDKIEYKGFNINIHRDDMAFSPRKEFDNVGKMVCLHSSYSLGDENISSKSEYEDYFADLLGEQVKNLTDYNRDQFLNKGLDWILDTLEKRYGFLILPLYLYDHSGITMSVSRFSCPWDSGQVGHIYATKEQIENEWGGDMEAARRYLVGEVEIYDDYLTGSVYWYDVEPINPENKIECNDSCGGYYGYDHEKSGLLESAKGAIDWAINDYKNNAMEAVKVKRAKVDNFMEAAALACAV